MEINYVFILNYIIYNAVEFTGEMDAHNGNQTNDVVLRQIGT